VGTLGHPTYGKGLEMAHSGHAAASRLGYRPELDGLRGIAIILVLLIHVLGSPKGGLLGVDIFFTLSGFLITTLLLEEWRVQTSISLRHFYLRRSFRLFPALAVFIVSYVLFVLAFGNGNDGMRLQGAGFAITYSANWVMAFNRPFPEWEIGHLWSLAVEEQFYLLWPAFLLLLLKSGLGLRGLTWTVLGMILAVVAWRTFLDLHGVDDSRLYFATDTRFDQLLVGCLASILFVSRGKGQAGSRALMFGGLVGALFLVWRIFEANFRSAWSFKIGLTLFATATALTIYACVTESFPLLKRALSAKWLVFVGIISYSLYLWHVASSLLLERLTHLNGWRSAVAEVAFAFIAACASYYLVELPFLRRRKAHERLGSTKVDLESGLTPARLLRKLSMGSPSGPRQGSRAPAEPSS
jgi:peptidoglycan/LPS O-acetylase OafA/YrhL